MINQVILCGRITAAPELRHTSENVAVASFSVAVDRKYSKKEAVTDFINVTAWRQNAEFACEYFEKGTYIEVVGELHQTEWKDEKGTKHKSYEVVADRVSFGGNSKKASSSPAPGSQQTPGYPQPPQIPSYGPAPGYPQAPPYNSPPPAYGQPPAPPPPSYGAQQGYPTQQQPQNNTPQPGYPQAPPYSAPPAYGVPAPPQPPPNLGQGQQPPAPPANPPAPVQGQAFQPYPVSVPQQRVDFRPEDFVEFETGIPGNAA